jgi:hypothetical protein
MIPDHTVRGLKFPSRAQGTPTDNTNRLIQPTPETLSFNPELHLQLEIPAYIQSIHGTRVEYPLPSTTSKLGSTLAFSAPFRVLSTEGVAAFRTIITNNAQHAGSNNRQPKSIRGIGYRSKFIRDFNYSKEVLSHLAGITGKALHPHDMGMNFSQINFGQIGNNEKVDVWHIDSVPYVMVLLLSDATDMVGGKLQVAKISDPTKALEIIYKKGELPSNLIDEVNCKYYCCVM